MPADARSLLRAQRQSATGFSSSSSSSSSVSGGDGRGQRISDRFASYHSKTGALRCLACGYTPIKHESLWASHVASKSHRANVAKIKADEQKKLEQEEKEEERRRIDMKVNVDDEGTSGSKRKGEEQGREEENKKAKVGSATDNAREADAVDPEWELFQREVMGTPDSAQAVASTSYANATVEVQPQLKTGIAREGPYEGEEEDEEEVAGEPSETDEERKARLEREEKEEIFARFDEEQRLQDEADERVGALKARLERMKAARAGKKGKTKGTKDGS